MPKKKLRPVGKIMCEMEDLLYELHLPKEEGGHDMQHQEVLGLINSWQVAHVPGQAPVYHDETLEPKLVMKEGPYPAYVPVKKKKSVRK